MSNKYTLVVVFGSLLAFLGIISVAFFPYAFPIEKRSLLGLTYTVPNTAFSYLGLGMTIIGGIIVFYGRYKYTKEEEKEDIERAKKGYD